MLTLLVKDQVLFTAHSLSVYTVDYMYNSEGKIKLSVKSFKVSKKYYIIFIFLDGLCWKKRIQVGHTAEQCILYGPLN